MESAPPRSDQTPLKPKKVKKPPSKYNMTVKKIMTEQKMKLAQASKYIKDNNLYTK